MWSAGAFGAGTDIEMQVALEGTALVGKPPVAPEDTAFVGESRPVARDATKKKPPVAAAWS